MHAIAGLRAAGKSVRQIARATGIPKSTVHDIASSDSAGQIIAEVAPKVTARLTERMWDLVNDETQPLTPMQLATMWGISMDKHQRAQQIEKPTQDNRTLVIVIPGLDPPVSRDDLPTIDGRHTTTTFDAPLDPDILPPSD